MAEETTQPSQPHDLATDWKSMRNHVNGVNGKSGGERLAHLIEEHGLTVAEATGLASPKYTHEMLHDRHVRAAVDRVEQRQMILSAQVARQARDWVADASRGAREDPESEPRQPWQVRRWLSHVARLKTKQEGSP